MIRIAVGDVAAATGATLVAGPAQTVVTNVQIDSRKVGEGSLFVAFPGERVDGNDFAPAAVRAGAAAVVLTAEPTQELLSVAKASGAAVMRAQADDGEEFMLRLAGEWRRRNPQWTVVGVTGSVGKTTTKEMLAAGLGAGLRVHATAGNFNNLIGVPLTIFAAPEDAQLLVVEMGMNHAGELTRISRAARPNVAVITNVGTSHIGNLGSRQNIARAKAEVLAGMEPKADGSVLPCLVLTGEDDFAPFIADEFAAPAGVDVLRVGYSRQDDVRAQDVRIDDEGLPSFDVAFPDGLVQHVSLTVPGRHMVSDFLSAMGIVWRLGVDRAAAAAAIQRMKATHMRLEVVQRPGTPRVIDDSYNASPSSIAAALDVLCSMRCEGRRVAVLGEVGELGQEAQRLHGYIGAYAAAKPIDLLVIIGGQDAATMASAAKTMGFSEDHLETFRDVRSAVETMVPVFDERDLVLVKASRAAGLDVFAKEVLSR